MSESRCLVVFSSRHGNTARFAARIGVTCPCTAIFAGALQYRSYAPPVRWMMWRIARRAGVSTDTSRDHVLTDWAAVDAFTDRARALLPVGATGSG